MVEHVRVHSRLSLMCVATAFALASLALGVNAPAAQAVDLVQITTCGQSVNTDAVLARNLTCPGDGVIVTGDGVTVDLGGYLLRSSTGAGRGVVIDGPWGSTATVRGPGRVRGFETGIDATNWSGDSGPYGSTKHHVIVNGIALLDNTSGLRLTNDLTDVTATTIRGTNGVANTWSGTLNVDSSSITSTGVAFGGQYGWNHLHVTNSHLRGGTVSFQANSGFSMADSTLRDVAFSCSESGGIIERSSLVNTSVSIQSTCSGTFSDNTLRSTMGGTAFDIGTGFQDHAVIEGNRFSGWDNAVRLGYYASNATIDGNRFEGNVTGVRQEVGGINLECPALDNPTNVLRTNTFVRNQGDAVFLSCGGWAVGGNTMRNNEGLGINASGPLVQVTDEGGNIARGNAEPQCVGVVCQPR